MKKLLIAMLMSMALPNFALADMGGIGSNWSCDYLKAAAELSFNTVWENNRAAWEARDRADKGEPVLNKSEAEYKEIENRALDKLTQISTIYGTWCK